MNLVPEHVQDAIDQYIELHAVAKQLEERMKPLRERILSFLKENQLESVRDRTKTGRVQLTVTERATMTSRFSSYDVGDLAKMLDPQILQKCVVEVVDKDKLEGLYKLGEIESDILSQRITKPTYSLVVKYEK